MGSSKTTALFATPFNFHTDAKTSAPFWPNLSTMCVSGRSYITKPEATTPQLQDDTPSEGLTTCLPTACISYIKYVLERTATTLQGILSYYKYLNAIHNYI